MRTETELPYGGENHGSDGNGSNNSNNGNSGGNQNSNNNSNDEYQDKSTTPPCPHCGKTDKVIPIIYGYPGEDLFREQQAGKLRLGGCCIIGDGSDPGWYCKRDKQEF